MITLFISHAWDYHSDYQGVVDLLNKDWTFRWRNFSIPFTDPVELPPAFPRSYGRIVDELRDKIRASDCLLVIGAMYCHYRGWIQTEIEAAKQFGKPIIAIKPLGQERLPKVIEEANEIVGWRTDSIIVAIRKLTAYNQVSLPQRASILVPPPITTPLLKTTPPLVYQHKPLFGNNSLTRIVSSQFELPTIRTGKSLFKKD